MLKYLIIVIMAFTAHFCSTCAYGKGSSHKQNINVDEITHKVVVDGIKAAYKLPIFDERYKFNSAITEALIIRDTVNKEGNSNNKLINNKERFLQDIEVYRVTYKIERKLNNGIQLVKPFLESNNKKIKLCAEHAIKSFKSEIDVNLLIRNPNRSNVNYQLAISKSLDDFEQFNDSLKDFYSSLLE